MLPSLRLALLLSCLALDSLARRVQTPTAHLESPETLRDDAGLHQDASLPKNEETAQTPSINSFTTMVKEFGTNLLALSPASMFTRPTVDVTPSHGQKLAASGPDSGIREISHEHDAVFQSKPSTQSSSTTEDETLAIASPRVASASQDDWNLGPSHPYVHRAMPRSGSLYMSLPMPGTAITNPSQLFTTVFCCLAGVAAVWRLLGASGGGDDKSAAAAKPEGVKSLQFRFLIVFWLIRMADWLQGPYFYEVYSSKVFNGVQASLGLVSKIFLVGFASTGLFGPWIGKLVDSVGRKAGTLAFTALYAVGALSTRSSILSVLLLGRLAGGIGTSLLFSAPEAWLVGESTRQGFDGKWLGQTFGWAYAGDALVAIAAGAIASASAGQLGPSGPFTVSTVFLLAGAVFAMIKWKENTAVSVAAASSSEKEDVPQTEASNPTVGEGLSMMFKDKRILYLGLVQSMFESAMYIFVLQWPPAMKAAIEGSSLFGPAAMTPYGIIFSCFMTCCLIGSTAFGSFQAKNWTVETSTLLMLLTATSAMSAATYFGSASLPVLAAAFFLFEACVGMYFPSIGTLRSKYLPDSHRSVLINLFGIPLNTLVVAVFLLIGRLGVGGALFCSSSALGVATLCMALLRSKTKKAVA